MKSEYQFNQHNIDMEALSNEDARPDSLIIYWGKGQTEFGESLIVWSERGLHELGFSNGGEVEVDLRNWLGFAKEQDQPTANQLLQNIFEKKSQSFALRPKGTPFQIRVWQALLSIKCGELKTYGEIAALIHQPNASRAVGSAVGKNPLSVLIPCHRVIQSGGKLGGYHWGVEKKAALIAAEKKDGKIKAR